jgi:hypothetical protein
MAPAALMAAFVAGCEPEEARPVRTSDSASIPLSNQPLAAADAQGKPADDIQFRDAPNLRIQGHEMGETLDQSGLKRSRNAISTESALTLTRMA